MLQGKEGDAILEVQIGRLFSSAPMGCKMRYAYTIHAGRTFRANPELADVRRPYFSSSLL